MDVEKLIEEGARELWKVAAINITGKRDLDAEWDAMSEYDREPYVTGSRAVLALALAAAAEDWIAVAQSGFETWKAKPHNARWFRKIDGTPIPNDLTICIGEAFAAALSAERRAKVEAESEAAALLERVWVLGKALEPFAEAATKGEIGGYPPNYFVGATEFENARRARTALEGCE